MSLQQSVEKTVKNNWDQIKDKVKYKWRRLSDSDLTQINGSYEALIDKLIEIYDSEEAELENDIRGFLKTLKIEKAKNVSDDIKQALSMPLKITIDTIKDKTDDLQKGVKNYVQENPLGAVMCALFVGILTTRLVTTRLIRK